MTKGSGLKKNVSSAILMLQEEGTLEKLKQRWFLNATECLTGTKDADQESEDDTATRGENTKLNLMHGQNILIKCTITLHFLATSDHFYKLLEILQTRNPTNKKSYRETFRTQRNNPFSNNDATVFNA